MYDIDITFSGAGEENKPITIKEIREIRVFDGSGKKVSSLLDEDFASFVFNDACAYTFIGSVAVFSIRGKHIINVIFYHPEV